MLTNAHQNDRPTSPETARGIIAEVSSPGLNTDSATAETARRMGAYITKAIADPGCQAAAEYAWRHFAGENKTAPMLAWAAFWYVKHCIKFRLDEATMFRIGRDGEFDLLIAPDVLVRMQSPAEDCDGFTMLTAALYSIMAAWFLPPGAAPVYIATVAAGIEDPERWSHVFAVTVIEGRTFPLDASHGVGPGWMVPRHHIFRFQGWDLDGRPVDIPTARFGGMHGYVSSNRPGMGAWSAPAGWTPKVIPVRYGMGAFRRRGMGQDEDDSGLDSSGILANLAPFEPTGTDSLDTSGILANLAPYEPTGIAPAASSSTTSPFNWTSFLNNLVTNSAAVAKVAEAPMTTYTLPNGTVITTPIASSNAALTSSLSSLSSGGIGPLLLLGLVGFLVFNAMENR
jgi:hypothetical protein